MLVDINGKPLNLSPVNNRGMTDVQAQRILDFLQGAVYVWCKLRCDEEFAAFYLVGGCNSNWGGTPLQDLYDRHKQEKSADPVKMAGIDCGYLLRRMLDDDKRKFIKTDNRQPAQHYKWLIN